MRKDKDEYRPPVWATRFLRFYCRPELVEDLEGDLNESFERNIKNKGVWRAKLILIIDVLPFLRLYTIRKPHLFNLSLQYTLWKNYSITAIRSYKKSKLQTSLNVLSLVLGISCFILISLHVLNELNFNHHYANADRIGRISLNLFSKTDNDTWEAAFCNVQLREELTSSYEEVEAATGILRIDNKIITRKGRSTFFESDFYKADPSYFKVFSHTWISGEKTIALDRPGCIVITRSLADKYFPYEYAQGKVLNVNNRDYEVTGVIEDLPLNTDIRFKALISLDRDFGDLCQTYVLFRSAEAMKGFQEKLDAHFDEYLGATLDNTNTAGSYQLEGLQNIHFGTAKLFDTPKGNNTVLFS